MAKLILFAPGLRRKKNKFSHYNMSMRIYEDIVFPSKVVEGRFGMVRRRFHVAANRPGH